MDFLSLVPQLHVPSDEYEAFTMEICTVLWQQITGKRPVAVVRAALRALSSFKPGSFTLRMLPAAARHVYRDLQVASPTAAKLRTMLAPWIRITGSIHT